MGTCLSTPQSAESLELLLQRPQKPRVKNILIRHTSSDHTEKYMNSEYLEISHLLKYHPKYYNSLTLRVTRQNRVLSKIKKIKKLKRFEGHFKDFLPQKIWLNLLASSSKEIEEMPKITCWGPLGTSLQVQKIKFFYNLRSILHQKDDIFLKEGFVKYLWGMRRLKTLRIIAGNVRLKNYDEMMVLIGRLNKMERFLCRLGTLSFHLQTSGKNHQGLTQNKTFFSYVTEMLLDSEFDPIYTDFLQMSKKLESFMYKFSARDDDDKSDFVNFLKPLQTRPQLKQLILLPSSQIIPNFWGYFKPQASLRYLFISISGNDSMRNSLFRERIEAGGIVEHWEDLDHLEELELRILYHNPEEKRILQRLMAMILKKAPKLRFLKLSFIDFSERDKGSSKSERFIVENMSHLNESLEGLDYCLFYGHENHCPKLDLRQLIPFRNLKKLKIEGKNFYCENVEEAVHLLEENQKAGEMSQLEIAMKGAPEGWLGETLKKIEKIKRKDKHLRLIFNLSFGTNNNSLELLGKLCKDIKATKAIKGLKIDLAFIDNDEEKRTPVPEQFTKVLSKFS